MKKVLFLIHTLGGGGAEKVLVNLANSMDKTKFDVTVMTVINTGIYRDSLNDDVKYKYIFNIPSRKKKKSIDSDNKSGSLLSKPSKIISNMGKIYSLIWKYMPTKLFYKLAIKEKYDVEIAFLEGICAKIISSSNNKDSKKISWIHVDLLNQKKSEFVFRDLENEKKCYEKFDEIVCVSNVVKDQFIKKFDINNDKVSVKYNPIDALEINEKANELVTDIEKPNKFTFCSVGRLITQKGYDRLLRVHKNLMDQGIDYELWIIGEGNKKFELQQFIEENKLQDTVKLLGFKNNPYKYMNLADAFVCSSRAEGFSTVASEATILGKPIVTVNCSGMNELLGYNDEYGIVTENNEEDLLNGMKRLILDENIFKEYKKRILERKNMFNLEKSVREIEEICR